MTSQPLKRALLGRRLATEQMHATLLPKWLALPVFCSDPLSSVAYATEQILLVLVLGGAAALLATPWVALAVAALLVVVVASYTRTVHAYPGGGGAYAVAKDNFGDGVALLAASALIIDYVLTVAVSVTAGVANFASAFPSLAPHVLSLSLAVVAVLTVANLRGVKESGRAFAVPTYLFIAMVLGLVAVGLVRTLAGDAPVAESAAYEVTTAPATGILAVFLLLRAFASGCTALTGVEAISNGVPHFRTPKSRNAALTLIGMGALAVVMFLGVTALSVISDVHIAEDPTDLGLPVGTVQPTVIAQLGAAVFGSGSAGFYILQLATAAVLVLAANTAYNSFPIMASVLGRDGYLPRQLGRRGDRLVFSNGVLFLAVAAGLLILAFDASVVHLVQLYILGVFLSFTVSQAGMVRYWNRALPTAPPDRRTAMRRDRAINALGATVTALVLVIVVATKFLHGAWIVVLATPLILLAMRSVRRHYEHTDDEMAAPPGGVRLPSRVHGVVPVARLNVPSMRALAYARATRPDTLVGLHVCLDEGEADALLREWVDRSVPVPLVRVGSPYRDLTSPVVEYVDRLRRDNPRDIVSVFVPEYVVSHRWENLLHNQSALRLRARLRVMSRVVVVSVPVVVGDNEDLGSRVAVEAVRPGKQ